MIVFALNEEQLAFRDAFRRLVDAKIIPRAREIDEAGEVPRAEVRAVVGAGREIVLKHSATIEKASAFKDALESMGMQVRLQQLAPPGPELALELVPMEGEKPRDETMAPGSSHLGHASGVGSAKPQWWQLSCLRKRCSTSQAEHCGHSMRWLACIDSAECALGSNDRPWWPPPSS